jgi:hypothetical protein
MKSQNVRENEIVFVATLVVTLLPKLKEDIEPVEDEVWSVSRHCDVLNNQQPPLRLRCFVCNRKLQLARFIRNFGDLHEKLQIAKNFVFFGENSNISDTNLPFFHLPVDAKNKNDKNQFTQIILSCKFFPPRRVGVKW